MGIGTIELVSQSEYARRRGCSEGAVRRAVRDGRITLINGKVDPVAADAQWQRNSRVRAGSRQSDDANLAAGGKPAARDDADEGEDYWKSRARREKTEADAAEIRLLELKGTLVRAEDVKAAHSRKLAQLREAILQIPARLSAILAAESSQAKCHDTLQREMHALLALVSEG